MLGPLSEISKILPTEIRDDLGNQVIIYALVSSLVLKTSLEKNLFIKSVCFAQLSLMCFLEIYNNKFSQNYVKIFKEKYTYVSPPPEIS